MRHLVREVRQADQIQQFQHALLPVTFKTPNAVGDVFGDRHVRKEDEVLKDHAEMPLLRRHKFSVAAESGPSLADGSGIRML